MRLSVLLIAAALVSCDRPPVRKPLVAGDGPFIALEREFKDFRAWERFQLTDRPAQGLTHTGGKRRIFLSARPPAGSRTFPVGTMIVKELVDGHREHKLFAMVKRGGGYNAAGAPGWEWFELVERGDGTVGIGWRGLDAPSGESYRGGSNADEADPLGGCNGCHGVARTNDFVKAPALTLDQLARPAS